MRSLSHQHSGGSAAASLGKVLRVSLCFLRFVVHGNRTFTESDISFAKPNVECNNRMAGAAKDRGDGAITFSDMLQLGHARWDKLAKDFLNRKKRKFDISKIPDIYDCVKYDVLHNRELLRLDPPHLQ